MRVRRHFRTGILLTSLAVLLATSPARPAEPGAQGTLTADTGFRPKPNGFNFPNWGEGENPEGKLTANDAQCLFGDGVCEKVAGGTCKPTPAARLWIDEMNRSMNGGHCEGLAALSAAFQSGKMQAGPYGGPSAFDLKVGNGTLLRMISTLYTTQYLDPLRSAAAKTKDMSMRQTIDTLVQAMQSKKDTLTLGIYGEEGGHALTPYAVEDVGAGRFLIHVYDNNYPGVGNVVEVDTGADTWRYAGAALNPAEASAPWEGKGPGSMDLGSQSLRFQPLECPFCKTPSSKGMCGTGGAAPGGQSTPAPRAPSGPVPTSVITTANCDQLIVTDKKSGKKVTFAKGKMVNPIAGVILSRRRGAHGCDVVLPPNVEYDVSVAGEPGQKPQPLDAAVFRPGQAINLDGATVTAGLVEVLAIGASSFSYKPSAKSHPVLEIATDDAGEDEYYRIDHLELGAGHVFEMNEDSQGRILFDTDDPNLDTFDIHARVEDEHAEKDYAFNHVDFDEHGQAILAPGKDEGLVYGMDTDKDGTINAVDDDDDNDGVPDAQEKVASEHEHPQHHDEGHAQEHEEEAHHQDHHAAHDDAHHPDHEGEHHEGQQEHDADDE